MGTLARNDAALFGLGLLAFAALAGLLRVLGLGTLVIEVSLIDFVVITVLVAGWAAWRTGMAFAATWRPFWQAALAMAAFALVVRWIHFALFAGTLRSFHYWAVDFIVCLALAALGYRQVRAAQMTTQYGWLYERAGLLSWRRRA